MSQDADALQRDVEAAKSAYEIAGSDVVTRLLDIFADAEEAADQILDVADEYGAEHAVAQLMADPERFGPCQPDAETRNVAEPTVAAIEAALAARDQLDQALRRRTDAARRAEPDAMQVLAFGGREFVVDVRRGELRCVDNPTERYLLVDRPDPPSPSVSATSSVDRAHDASLAQPKPGPDRKPDRGR